MKACFSKQMREMDKRAFDEAGILGIVLMENAAFSCVKELQKSFCDLFSKKVAIFCGRGNNGGDGLAIARHLKCMGVDVSVYIIGSKDYEGDALINYEIIKNFDIEIETVNDTEAYDYIIASYDVVIDAIFGTGIHGTVTGIAAEIIEKINKNAKYVMSVDIPSGMDADSGEICGVCINADKTVTFGAYKVGMFMYPAADFTGEICVYDISIPESIRNDEKYSINVLTASDIEEKFPNRENNSQKGDYGKLLIIAGSLGMSGAAYLSSEASMLMGSGLVTLAVPDCINTALETKTTEVMTLPLESCMGHLSKNSINDILKKMEKSDAVLIGPGLGTSDDVVAILEFVLKNSTVPVIVDADAINIVSKNHDLIKNCNCDLIFTPHAMEMSRLSGLSIEYIEKNRLTVCHEMAEEFGAVMLLKGHHTVVTALDGVQYINNTGNPGLACGGSGDVLAGMIAAMAARGVDTALSAAMAAYIHGAAGDLAAEKYGMESVMATKVLEFIPEVLKSINYSWKK